jgi:glycerol-3-phosphate dehydrogenase (NAD(P)+)
METKKVCVLVAGSWGTALASVLADNHHQVIIWSRNESQVKEINEQHENKRFLPDVQLSADIQATTSISDAVTSAAAVILAAPTTAMREVVKQMQPHLSMDTLIIHAAKGFEMESLKRMSTVIADELTNYDSSRIVVLSGPSHAEEVIRKCPTTVVVASENAAAAEEAQDLLINTYFRVYTNPDIVGVEVSGALKNIIAIGAGLSDGLGFGDNAKAALLTRGLAEISRLGMAMGANPLTFAGLAGIGDLIVTCTSKHSRNWRAGYLMAQGDRAEEVLSKMGMVVEGIKTTKSAYVLSRKFNIQMPITDELYKVLFEEKTPKLAVEDLMGRVRANEIEEAALSSHAKWMQ